MSLEWINNLPPEVITQVFDFLSFADRFTVSTICTRWYEILSDDRYTRCCRLRLEPKLLAEGNYGLLNRYRSVSITVEDFNAPEDQQRLRQYLTNSEMVNGLIDLELKLNVSIWNKIFGREKILVFPNLRTLYVLLPEDDLMDADVIPLSSQIVAPNLKTINYDNNVKMPLNLFNENLEKLTVKVKSEGLIFPTVFSQTLSNLRSLSLQQSSYYNVDFHSEHGTLFGRLNHLKIVDCCESFFHTSNKILEHSTNLKSLELYGPSICKTAFRQINQLMQLEELTLKVRNIPLREVPGLSLPKLAKLETFLVTLVPLDNVPSLRSLTIQGRLGDAWIDHFGTQEFIGYFRRISQFIEYLKFNTIYLDSTILDMVSEFKNLSSLKMIQVETEIKDIQAKFTPLTNLKLIRCTDCTFTETMEFCQGHHCHCYRCVSGEQSYLQALGGGPLTERYRQFYANLVEENAHCSIVAEGGRVLERYIRK